MGLFSWFKKKKKKQNEKTDGIRQAGLVGEVTDRAVRQAFYNECSELIDEAIVQSEQAKNEYSLVTTYLSDVQKIEALTGDGRAEVEAAANSLMQAVTLRAQSVLGQIEGTIPSTRDGQSAAPEKLLDTNGADFSGLGSGGMGGGRSNMNFPGFGF